jgi:cobalt-zinc-cadmium efflux system membrane fusion protein
MALVIAATELVLGSACRKEADRHQEHGEEHGREKVGPEPARQPESDPDVLRVDPAMVRDLRITTKPVESRAGGEEVTLLGELQPDQDAYAEVGTPVDGRVSRLMAGPGDLVAAGAALVEIESVTLGRARAAEVSARAKAELSRQVVERKRKLTAENLAPGRELDEAEADAKAAEAEWRAARTSLRAFGTSAAGEAAGARFVLRAPIAGTVLERRAARGQVVDPEATLFRIADLRSLWLTVQAFERDALRLKVGVPARVTFPALPGRTFEGKVVLVGSQVDVASRTIPVRVTVSNGGGPLRPGMSGSAVLPVGGSTAALVAVPTAAVQRLDRDWVVFLPRAERHTFEIRQVGRGRDLGDQVEILSHLRAGETVVVDGAFLLKAQAEKARGMGEQHEH